RRVVASAAVAPCERREPWLDRLGVGQLLAQLKRQLAEQILGLADQVLAAGEDRPAPVVPQGQQLMLLVRALLLARALERLGQQRVRQHLPRDPLAVEHVGLAALTRPVLPWRTVRAHVAYVIAAAGQEHRRVPPPARRPLDPPAHDLPKLQRPRLQLAVP